MTDPFYIMEALTDAILRVQEHRACAGLEGPLFGKMSSEFAEALEQQAVESGAFGPLRKMAQDETLLLFLWGIPFRVMPPESMRRGMWFLLIVKNRETFS